MSKQDLRQFATAVFFLFAAIGPLSLLMDPSIVAPSWVRLLIMTAISGIFSWSIVRTFAKPLRLAAAVIAYVIVIFSLSYFRDEIPQTDVPEIVVSADGTFQLSPEQITDREIKRIAFGMTAVACIAVGYALFVRALGKANKRRAEIEAEVQLARAIHDSLLPKAALTTEWCEMSGASMPASQIGGDFFDTIAISETRVLAVIADASGHGAGAGILSAMTKSSIMQELAHTQSAAELLRNVNRTIHAVTKKNMFVTCAAALFDRQTMTATLVTAGHPPILRYDPVTDTVDEFRNPNLALGISPAAVFSATTIPFRTGDLFCLITDGLTETSNPAQEQFGMDAIRAFLRRSALRPADDSSAALIAEAARHSGTVELNDDITTLIVRIL